MLLYSLLVTASVIEVDSPMQSHFGAEFLCFYTVRSAIACNFVSRIIVPFFLYTYFFVYKSNLGYQQYASIVKLS